MTLTAHDALRLGAEEAVAERARQQARRQSSGFADVGDLDVEVALATRQRVAHG